MSTVPSTVVKLAAFAAALVVAFGAAFVLGKVVAPVTAEADGPLAGGGQNAGTDPHGMAASGEESDTAESGHSGEGALPGLLVSDSGYTLVPETTILTAGGVTQFSFSVTDPDGAPLMSYAETHEKDLHLIVIRRDLVGFRHVHPTLASDGTWTAPLELAAAGTYRIFADFAPAGLDRSLTLGIDLEVAGEFVPVPVPEPAAMSSLDGYDVTIEGDAVAGAESHLTFSVSRDGVALTDLEPYLGAFGHLVSLRVGDLAYLHTHPIDAAEAGAQGGPAVEFGTEFPTAGTYRLFLDFQHDGAVHTAEFTVTVHD